MKISKALMPYILGQKYNNDLRERFDFEDDDREYASRLNILADICKGKKIIHVGCVDHEISSVKHKIKRKKWLHKILCESADRCLGVDIQEEGIKYIRDELGYTDSVCMDIFDNQGTELAANNWDYMLIPEVLEHIGNPVDFLQKTLETYKGNVDKLVLTVPNAFAAEHMGSVKKGIEVINSDHRYWFTPYTLCKVVSDAGFQIEKFIMCKQGIVKKRSVFKNFYYRRHPLMRNDIVLIARF